MIAAPRLRMGCPNAQAPPFNRSTMFMGHAPHLVHESQGDDGKRPRFTSHRSTSSLSCQRQTGPAVFVRPGKPVPSVKEPRLPAHGWQWPRICARTVALGPLARGFRGQPPKRRVPSEIEDAVRAPSPCPPSRKAGFEAGGFFPNARLRGLFSCRRDVHGALCAVVQNSSAAISPFEGTAFWRPRARATGGQRNSLLHGTA